MKLTIKERLMILNILPKQSNFATLKIVRKLEEDLSFSENEYKEFGFDVTEINGQVITKWNSEKNQEVKDIKIGEKALDIIVESLKKLDNEKKLTQDHYVLYKKFVEDKNA